MGIFLLTELKFFLTVDVRSSNLLFRGLTFDFFFELSTFTLLTGRQTPFSNSKSIKITKKIGLILKSTNHKLFLKFKELLGYIFYRWNWIFVLFSCVHRSFSSVSWIFLVYSKFRYRDLFLLWKLKIFEYCRLSCLLIFVGLGPAERLFFLAFWNLCKVCNGAGIFVPVFFCIFKGFFYFWLCLFVCW